jgi:hypothetical protein
LDGVVTIDELVTAVGIALGDETQCLAADMSADGTVSVDELVLAVRSAMVLEEEVSP